MGLVHWWPLNGDTKDYGLNPTATISGTPTYATGGKIGQQCLNTSNTITITDTDFSGKRVWSICFWGYIISANVVNNWTGLCHIHDGSSNIRFEVCPSTYNNGRNCYSFHNNSGNAIFSTNTSSMPNGGNYDKWTHIALVCDGEKLQLYINGLPLTGYAAYNGSGTINGVFSLRNNHICKKNDVRIYDHALSAKEVKEISKCLILHYNFEDENSEPTTNLDPLKSAMQTHTLSMSNSGGMTYTFGNYYGYDCFKCNFTEHTVTAWSGTYMECNPFTYGAVVGDTVVRSYWLFVPDNGLTPTGSFPNSIEGTADNKTYKKYDMTKRGTWQLVWAKCTLNSNGSPNMLNYFTSVSANQTIKDFEFYIRDFQLEIKNHVTPYTSTSRPKNLLNEPAANSSNGFTVDNTHPFGNWKVYKCTQSGNESSVYKTMVYQNLSSVLKPGDTITMSGYFYTENKSLFDGYTGSEFRVYQTFDSSSTNYSGINWTDNHRDGEWIRYSKTYTIDSNASGMHFSLDIVKNGTFWVSGLQVEYGNTVTQFEGYKNTSNDINVPDVSGYGYNGTQTIGNVKIYSNTADGMHSAYFDGSTKIVIPYTTQGLSTLTYSAWVYPTARHSERSCICIGGTYFTITSSGKLSGYAYGKSPAGYHVGTTTIPLNTWSHIAIVWDESYIYGYVNGVEDFKIACTGTFSGSTQQQIGIENTGGRNYTGYIGDFKIYSTALSADDIKLEYSRKASIDRNGNLFAGDIVEYDTSDNLIELAAFNIETQVDFDGHLGSIKKSSYEASYPNATKAGLGKYTQNNLSVTMTNLGVRIYSAPNLTTSANGNTMWGGLCISPMKHANCIIKGHRYRLSFHVSGQSSRDMSDIYFSSQVGWGNVCAASPSNVKIVRHGSNFQGEKDCYFEFTVNDDIWKICPDTNVSGTSGYNSAFTAGETYLSYAAIKLGYGYGSTGTLGTDIYISNIKLHDITDNKVYKIDKNDMIKTTEIVAGKRNSARIHSAGIIDVNNIHEN